METKIEKAATENKGISTRIKRTLTKLGMFAFKHSAEITAAFMFCLLLSRADITAFAEDTTENGGGGLTTTTASGAADDMWNTITALVTKWIGRLGGAVIFVGGIMFGLGWKSDDAEQKSRGINTIIAGAIVAAMAGLATVFFNAAG